MGLTRTVRVGAVFTPEAVRGALAACGLPVQVRMIDGQLAFPDEVPPADWREIRVSLPAGMVTIQRHGDQLDLVTWGNADAALLGERDRLAEALARAVAG